MKLENPYYRLNQRLDKGTTYGSFEWKIRLELSQIYCIINPITFWTQVFSKLQKCEYPNSMYVRVEKNIISL